MNSVKGHFHQCLRSDLKTVVLLLCELSISHFTGNHPDERPPLLCDPRSLAVGVRCKRGLAAVYVVTKYNMCNLLAYVVIFKTLVY